MALPARTQMAEAVAAGGSTALTARAPLHHTSEWSGDLLGAREWVAVAFAVGVLPLCCGRQPEPPVLRSPRVRWLHWRRRDSAR